MKQIILSAILLLFSFLAIADQYRVELCVFEQSVSSNYFEGISNVKLAVDNNNLYRYYLGDFEDKAEAEALLKKAKLKGCKYARLVNFSQEQLACANSCTPTPRIENIFFDYDQYTLRPKSVEELNDVSLYLKGNPEHRVRLSGHTDHRGTESYNIRLASNRANAAKFYLLRTGIEDYRILVQEFGEGSPIARNTYFGSDSPEGRQFNRRVMFSILDRDGNEIKGIVKPIDIPELLRLQAFQDTDAFLTMVL